MSRTEILLIFAVGVLVFLISLWSVTRPKVTDPSTANPLIIEEIGS